LVRNVLAWLHNQAKTSRSSPIRSVNASNPGGMPATPTRHCKNEEAGIVAVMPASIAKRRRELQDI